MPDKGLGVALHPGLHADASAEGAVVENPSEALIPGLNDPPSSVVRKTNAAFVTGVGGEVFGSDFGTSNEREHEPVDEQRFERFGKIEGERWAAVSGFVEEPDGGVEGGLGQGSLGCAVGEHAGERDERVYRVGWRSALAGAEAAEGVPTGAEQPRPEGVGEGGGVAFNAAQGIERGRAVDGFVEGVEGVLGGAKSVGVFGNVLGKAPEHHAPGGECRANEGTGDIEAAGLVEAGGGLGEAYTSRYDAGAGGVKRSGGAPRAVGHHHRDARAPEQSEHPPVEVDFAKQVDDVDGFEGEAGGLAGRPGRVGMAGFPRLIVGVEDRAVTVFEYERTVAAGEATVAEEVEWASHGRVSEGRAQACQSRCPCFGQCRTPTRCVGQTAGH